MLAPHSAWWYCRQPYYGGVGLIMGQDIVYCRAKIQGVSASAPLASRSDGYTGSSIGPLLEGASKIIWYVACKSVPIWWNLMQWMDNLRLKGVPILGVSLCSSHIILLWFLRILWAVQTVPAPRCNKTQPRAE